MPTVSFANARRMRERLEIQSPIETTDEYGDSNEPRWITEETVWASIRPLEFRDRERLIASGVQVQETATHEVIIRSVGGLTSKKRFRFQGTRILEMDGNPADRRERGVMMSILCKEVVGQDG